MNKIIDFLQSQSENENISENSLDNGKLSKSFLNMKNVVVKEVSSVIDIARISIQTLSAAVIMREK